jgi:hypothetical protein
VTFLGAGLAGVGKVAMKYFTLSENQSRPFYSPQHPYILKAGVIYGPSVAATERPYVYPMCMPQASQLARFFGGVTGAIPSPTNWNWVVSPVLDDRTTAQTLQSRMPRTDAGDRKPRVFTFDSKGQWKYIVSGGLNLSPEDASNLAATFTAQLGATFQSITLTSLLGELSINPTTLPICHFTQD